MLSLLIVSNDQESQRTVFDFSSDVLSQIGLAYPFAFIFVAKKPRVQLTAAAVILVAYWFAFYIYPLVPISSGYGSMNNPGGIGTFDGFYGHWNKNTNVAAAFDRWFLNLFPRTETFRNHNAGLQTLNFIPSIVTLVMGLMAGEFLKKPLQPRLKFRKLCGAGLLSLLVGLFLGGTLCPIVKAIWTPSWVLFSSGFALWFLAAFYWLVDIKGWTRSSFPLIVVGANPLAMYLMMHLSRNWIWKTVEVHTAGLFWTGRLILVNVLLWLVCFWMYRKKIFVRL